MISFTKKDIVPFGILAGMLGVFLVVLAFGQVQSQPQKPLDNTKTPSAVAVPTPTPAPTPTLELTEPEQRFLKLLLDRLAPIQQGLQSAWQGMLTTEDEKEAVTLWLKARLLDVKSKDINKDFTEWFEKVKLAHKCPDCALLQGGKLVAPASAVPTPSPTTPGKP